jgi:hypothetical protein
VDIGDSQSKTVLAGYLQTVEVKEAMVNASATEGGGNGTKSAGK